MDKTGVFPIKNNASNLAGLMFSIVDTTTAMKRPLMLRNNVFSNFTSSNFAPRKSLNDEVSSDRKGKRKIVNEIDFFSSEKRKMPKLEPGLQPSLVSHIKEEDITLQVSRLSTFVLFKILIIFIVQNVNFFSTFSYIFVMRADWFAIY